MASTAPNSAIRRARRRNQAGRESRMPATISIDGTSYRGAAWIGDEAPEMTDGGIRRVQRFAAWIPKERLRTRPTEETEVIIEGLGFAVMEIAGDDPQQTEWVIRGMRMPGRDR